MLFAVIIMFVFVVGAGVLLFTTPVPEAEPPSQIQTPLRPGTPDDTDIVSLPGNNPVSPSPEPDPPPETPEPDPEPEIRHVIITYNGRENKDFTARVGERVDLKVTLVPDGIEAEVIWESSNESIFQVVALNTAGTSARVTGVGRGTAAVTASVGEVVAETIVRIR